MGYKKQLLKMALGRVAPGITVNGIEDFGITVSGKKVFGTEGSGNKVFGKEILKIIL